MKRVAILSPDFTPSGYPPALRTRFFASHLREFGWEPVIITLDPKYYEWEVDPENLQLLPESLRVIRTHALPASLTRMIGVGDIGLRSLWHHWRALKDLCQKKLIDLIFVSSPPFFPLLLGRLAYEFFRVPYVVDYIDPWIIPRNGRTRLSKQNFKRRLSSWLSVILEPFVLGRAGCVTAVSKGTLKLIFDRYAWLSRDATAEIPYGGMSNDFDYLARHPRQNKIFNSKDGFFHLSCVGTFPETMLSALRTLLEAVRSGLLKAPGLFGRLRLHFVGTTYQGNGLNLIMPMAQSMGLEKWVDESPKRVSYLDSLQILLDSDALLILGSTSLHYTPSRVFPSILSGKPILAILHEASSAVGILKEAGTGRVLSFSNEGELALKADENLSHLEQILTLPSGFRYSVSREFLCRYEAREMTSRLAQIFNRAVST